jgi:hypothetical protein
MKLAPKLGLGLFALLVLLALAVFFFLDSLVRSAVEKGGTHATGTPVDLATADLALFGGKLDLEGFTVANPPGFRDEPFVRMGTMHADWQSGTLFSDELVIDELAIDGIAINLERASGATNFGKILDHVKSRGGKPDPDAPPDAGPKKTLIVKRIVITDIGATVHLDGVPLLGGSFAVKVPRIEIADFKSDGSTKEIIAKLSGAVIDAVLAATVDAGDAVLPKELVADLKRDLADVKKQAKDALEEAKKDLEDVKDIFKKKP